MKKFIKWFLILLIIVILSGWFYWFEWRPYNVRKKCNNDAVNKVGKILNKRRADNWIEIKSFYNTTYLRCLRENGIKE